MFIIVAVASNGKICPALVGCILWVRIRPSSPISNTVVEICLSGRALSWKLAMKIFVTGADGFIGSHLTESLVKSGYEVRALAQYNSFNSHGWLSDLEPNVFNQLEIVSGDVRDGSQMKGCMAGCDAVVHLAALIAIPYSYLAPRSY